MASTRIQDIRQERDTRTNLNQHLRSDYNAPRPLAMLQQTRRIFQ